MGILLNILGDNLGLAGDGLAGAVLSIGEINEGTEYGWILNRAVPQTKEWRGLWDDSNTWKDASVWYD